MFVTIAALALLHAGSADAAQAPAPTNTPPSCDTEAHAAFDFWLGEWEVYNNGTDTKVANSRIERLYNGCAVRENWMPLQGAGGGSLNNLDPATGRWHQTWIGSSPGRVEFEGGHVDGTMVLTGYWANLGGPDRDGLVRMTYSAEGDGAVRQYGQMSFDHGASWQDSFDLLYRPRTEAPTEDSK